MGQVNLTVNGRVYRMACEDGEEDHVSELGTRLDAAIDELRAALGELVTVFKQNFEEYANNERAAMARRAPTGH